MDLKFLKNRIFPSRRHIRRCGIIVSDVLHRRHPFAGIMMKNLLICYFCGNRVRHLPEVESVVTEPLTLYHMTSSSLLPEIRKNGLQTKDFVFLTDDTGFFDHYLPWKERQPDCPAGTHILITVDTEALLGSGHPVCKLKKKNEYITDRVPPECFSAVTDYPGQNTAAATEYPCRRTTSFTEPKK